MGKPTRRPRYSPERGFAIPRPPLAIFGAQNSEEISSRPAGSTNERADENVSLRERPSYPPQCAPHPILCSFRGVRTQHADLNDLDRTSNDFDSRIQRWEASQAPRPRWPCVRVGGARAARVGHRNPEGPHISPDPRSVHPECRAPSPAYKTCLPPPRPERSTRSAHRCTPSVLGCLGFLGCVFLSQTPQSPASLPLGASPLRWPPPFGWHSPNGQWVFNSSVPLPTLRPGPGLLATFQKTERRMAPVST
jgi:hypothetical protein